VSDPKVGPHWIWIDPTTAALAAALLSTADLPGTLAALTAEALKKAMAAGSEVLDVTVHICEQPYVSAIPRGGDGSADDPYLLEPTIVLSSGDMLPLLRAWPEFTRAVTAQGLETAGQLGRAVAELASIRKGDWLIADGHWDGFEKGEPYAVHSDSSGLFVRDKNSRKVRFKGRYVEGIILIGFRLSTVITPC
jgi:hypothetical protein